MSSGWWAEEISNFLPVFFKPKEMSQHRWRGCDRYTVSNLSRSSTTCLGSCYIPLTLIVQQRCVTIYICAHAINTHRKWVLWTHGNFCFQVPNHIQDPCYWWQAQECNSIKGNGSKTLCQVCAMPRENNPKTMESGISEEPLQKGIHPLNVREGLLPSQPPSRKSHPVLIAHLLTLFVMDQRCSTRAGRDQRHQWGHPCPLSPLPKFCHLPRLG